MNMWNPSHLKYLADNNIAIASTMKGPARGFWHRISAMLIVSLINWASKSSFANETRPATFSSLSPQAMIRTFQYAYP